MAGRTLWSLPLRGAAEGNSLNLKGPNQTWTQGREPLWKLPAGALPGKLRRQEEALRGLLPHPVPEPLRARVGASQGPVPPWLRAPEASSSLRSAWGGCSETLGCPGKDGRGRPAGPVLGRSCPFLGRILMQSPTPGTPPLRPALPLPAARPDSLEGTGGGVGRRLASLVPEPVCSARTPSQRPHQPLQEAPGRSVSITEKPGS